MKIDLKKIALGTVLAASLVSSSVFAGPVEASNRETTIVVKAGNVTSDAEYNVEVGWSDMTYDYVELSNKSGYQWQPQSEENGSIWVTNYSNVAVTSNMKFNPIIDNIDGEFSNITLGEGSYVLLTVKPSDWDTDADKYYSAPFVKLAKGTVFEENKYYSFEGFGGGETTDNKIPAMVEINGQTHIFRLDASLNIKSTGPISKSVKTGAALGTVTITID